MKPGEIIFGAGTIHLNANRPRRKLEVRNVGNRTVFISSHFPIAAANPALELDRVAATGYHLDIPAGDTLRFLPGQSRSVDLVAYGGEKLIRGFTRVKRRQSKGNSRDAM